MGASIPRRTVRAASRLRYSGRTSARQTFAGAPAADGVGRVAGIGEPLTRPGAPSYVREYYAVAVCQLRERFTQVAVVPIGHHPGVRKPIVI